MKETLQVLYGEVPVGSLDYDRRKDQISLSYDDAWQFGAESFPMSLSLPLARRAHPDAAIRPFLQGLLPDNPAVIEAWGKRFQVSPRSPFDVIKHVGEDCAGALQFIRPERLDLILSGDLDSLTPLNEDDLANRMIDLKSQARSIPTQIEGRFSLAGAQTKDALHLKDGQWFVPAGRIPSTHILKPELEDFEEHALNEHFCLQLAATIGLPSAESSLFKIGGKKILSVKRYDRLTDLQTGKLFRVHQEDTCQALGRSPQQKYQSDGPASADIVKLLDRFSDNAADDIVLFMMALAFNWVIAGTDGHCKNYSILHWRGSSMRMAPLYDLASFLPYLTDPNSTKVKLAMKIGGTYRLHQINKSRWRSWATEAGLSPEGVVEVVCLTINRISESLDPIREKIADANKGPFLQVLADKIAGHARLCGELMK